MNFNPNKIRLDELLPDEILTPDVAAVQVSSVELDSRAIQPGGLFIAVKGATSDGRDFIPQALSQGAVAVLAESESASLDWIGGVPVIHVPDLAKQVGLIAARFYRHPSTKVKVIGVTGTNGKSTCVSLIAQIISLLGEKAGVIGTLGYGFADETPSDTGMTTPDAIKCQKVLHELAERGANVVAMEVSSHGISQHRVEGIRYFAAAFTNLTRDHLDYHESFEEYGAAKASLFSRPELSFSVVNVDDGFGTKIVETSAASGVPAYTLSVSNPVASVHAKNITLNNEGVVADVVTPWGEATIRSSLAGEFNLANILTAITCVCGAGFDFADVCRVIAKVNAVAGRMQRVTIDAGDNAAPLAIDVFIDYAHTPDALERALATLKKSVANKLWVVFGCGGDRDRGKRSVMGAIAEKLADCVVITSDNPRTEDPAAIVADIEKGVASGNFVSIVERGKAIEYAVREAQFGDCVLVAGKGHENYQIIGKEKTFFDDYLVAKAALEKRYQISGATL